MLVQINHGLNSSKPKRKPVIWNTNQLACSAETLPAAAPRLPVASNCESSTAAENSYSSTQPRLDDIKRSLAKISSHQDISGESSWDAGKLEDIYEGLLTVRQRLVQWSSKFVEKNGDIPPRQPVSKVLPEKREDAHGFPSGFEKTVDQKFCAESAVTPNNRLSEPRPDAEVPSGKTGFDHGRSQSRGVSNRGESQKRQRSLTPGSNNSTGGNDERVRRSNSRSDYGDSLRSGNRIADSEERRFQHSRRSNRRRTRASEEQNSKASRRSRSRSNHRRRRSRSRSRSKANLHDLSWRIQPGGTFGRTHHNQPAGRIYSDRCRTSKSRSRSPRRCRRDSREVHRRRQSPGRSRSRSRRDCSRDTRRQRRSVSSEARRKSRDRRSCRSPRRSPRRRSPPQVTRLTNSRGLLLPRYYEYIKSDYRDGKGSEKKTESPRTVTETETPREKDLSPAIGRLENTNSHRSPIRSEVVATGNKPMVYPSKRDYHDRTRSQRKGASPKEHERHSSETRRTSNLANEERSRRMEHNDVTLTPKEVNEPKGSSTFGDRIVYKIKIPMGVESSGVNVKQECELQVKAEGAKDEISGKDNAADEVSCKVEDKIATYPDDL